MADALVRYLRQSLPDEIAHLSEPYIAKLERGEYESLLRDPEAQALFGHVDDSNLEGVEWNDFIFQRLGAILADRSKPEKQIIIFCVGYAALLAFLQSNVTGPPLSFAPPQFLLPRRVADSKPRIQDVRQALVASLGSDGIAAYRLTPNVELLCLADSVMIYPAVLKNIKAARWTKMRIAFLHQRLLSENSTSLQNAIYEDLAFLEGEILDVNGTTALDPQSEAEFLLERATIHIYHGLDKLAQADLERAKRIRGFDFALTGLLGKRTKFQEKDTSQLVVLAKSADGTQSTATHTNGSVDDAIQRITATTDPGTRPANLDLNDDTLLETISFAKPSAEITAIKPEASLPQSLASLDPSDQPPLDPIDSTILLSFASSITNTSPQDGLTREETLPYAVRVLDGGSSNWQVYTQALLVRSRIEGFKSRTIERGLLQLQALVDQVVADTTSSETMQTRGKDDGEAAPSFLPRPKDSENAPVTERMRYLFQLASPTRWDLEAELAARWVQLGGLRSALEIYERLEMWADAALCWAATDREQKAKRVIRRQLFHQTGHEPGTAERHDDEDETWEGPERVSPPLDAPRLYCILGDIDQSPAWYEKAWEVSKHRYARAQRSLGRHYFFARDFLKAAAAYSKSLRVDQLNRSSWFALGCALLELAQFKKAVDAFSRCVQLDDNDAEAWSNLAAALLRQEEDCSDTDAGTSAQLVADDKEEEVVEPNTNPKQTAQQNRLDALRAFKRAASLKYDSHRIWENVLTVAASLSPPDYPSIMAAQKHIVALRGHTDGEKCIDKGMLELLTQHVISTNDIYNPSQPGLPRMFVKFIDESVIPLITGSADLWRLVGKLALWRGKPLQALDAEEKAWRAITSQPGWETESEKRWNDVVEATVRLCDSYESLGPRERTEGLGAGEPVAKDWRFKARSAIRGIMGRGKGSWEGTEGWERLKEATEGLKA